MIFQLNVLSLKITNKVAAIRQVELWNPAFQMPEGVSVEMEYGIPYDDLLQFKDKPLPLPATKLHYYATSLAQYNMDFFRVQGEDHEPLNPYFRAAYGDTLEKIKHSFRRGFKQKDKDWLALMFGVRIERAMNLRNEHWKLNVLAEETILLDVFLGAEIKIKDE